MDDAGIVEQVRELRPLIRRNALRAERGRVPDEVADALTGTGINRMNVPRRYGGHRTPLGVQVDAFAEIAAECASTAWTTLSHAGVAYITALFPDEAQDDFFTGPKGPDVRIGGTLVPGATAVPYDGGYVVNGASGFATGCHHADWHLLTAAVAAADGSPPDGPPEVVRAAVPMAEPEILDDWHAHRSRPHGQQHRPGPGRSRARAPRAPGRPDARRAAPLEGERGRPVPPHAGAAALLRLGGPGGARGGPCGEAEFGERSRRGITCTSYERQYEAAVTHFQVAEAQLRISGAELVAARPTREIADKAGSGAAYTPLERARIRAGSGCLTRLCKEAVDLLASAAGASSLQRDVPVQRIARDINALCLQSFVAPSTDLEIHGRVLSGVDPRTPFL
ncbi:acyl-CoA dehydrogenase family protein [Streptomyces fructofermentans]|uniref:acyl-CoA dehydrogenase family protein n=1 Tax=Streptomyces fructofermentans TaxID=152141 RepID=UPI0037AE82C7